MRNPLASIVDLEGYLPRQDLEETSEIEKLAIEEKDQARRKEEAERKWKEKIDADKQVECQTERLIRYICDSFEAAKNARQCNGIDEKILTGRRLKKGEYTEQEKQKIDGIDVWFNLTDTMSRIALAFLRSILTEDPNHPLWEIKPNEIPELPEEVVEQATQIAVSELTAAIEQTGVGLLPGELEERIGLMRAKLFEVLERQAETRIRNLERKIESNLQIADWDEVFDDFLQDFVCDPNATIKGPVVSAKPIKEWRDNKLRWPVRKYQHYETVSADRLFPSSDSTTPHNGVFIIHLNRMTRHDLNQAKKLKGFIAENIEILLCEFESKCLDWLSPIEDQMEIMEDRQGTWRQDEYIDVIEYYGKIPGDLLKTMGIERYKDSRINDKDAYEYEIWVVDKHIIRAQPAANVAKRPFHTASMYPVCGSFWGNGLPHITEDMQRTANAFYRAAVRDVGYSSGPYFEYDIGLQDMDTGHIPDVMHPGLTLKKNSLINPTRGDILKAHHIKSQAQLYMVLIDQVFLQAELQTGISRQMLGQAQPGIGTLGESQILEANSAIGMRSMLVNIDKAVIEPLIDMTACQIMMVTDDDSLKGDARVEAYGAKSLLTKQLNKDRKLQILNTILPFYQTQPGIIEPDGIAYLLRQIMEDLGEDPDKLVMDPDSVAQQKLELQQALALQGGTGGTSLPGPGNAGGTAQPPQTPAAGLAGQGLQPPQVS